MHIKIPELSLVVLVGPSGSGKSTFARKHFLSSAVLSSDACRAMVSDDQNDQSVTNHAFELLHYIAGKRLTLGRLVVVDATNVQPEARKPLVQLARKFHCLPVAVVLNAPEDVCLARNRERDDRTFGSHVVRQQRSQLRRSLKALKREGFRHVFVMNSVDEIDAATVERVPLWNDKRDELGPFDIIGDVHGCCGEIEELLEQLGYRCASHAPPTHLPLGSQWYAHRTRKAVFVGDLVDRGPRVVATVQTVMNMVAMGGRNLCPR